MELDLYLNIWKKLRAASLFEIEDGHRKVPRREQKSPAKSSSHLHMI